MGNPSLSNAGFVVLLNDFLGVHELLLRDAVSLHELFFIDGDGAEPLGSDGGNGEGHDLEVFNIG